MGRYWVDGDSAKKTTGNTNCQMWFIKVECYNECILMFYCWLIITILTVLLFFPCMCGGGGWNVWRKMCQMWFIKWDITFFQLYYMPSFNLLGEDCREDGCVFNVPVDELNHEIPRQWGCVCKCQNNKVWIFASWLREGIFWQEKNAHIFHQYAKTWQKTFVVFPFPENKYSSFTRNKL